MWPVFIKELYSEIVGFSKPDNNRSMEMGLETVEAAFCPQVTLKGCCREVVLSSPEGETVRCLKALL